MISREARAVEALGAHPRVRDRAVVVRDEEVVAFVVLAREPFVAERAAVREKLWEMIFDKAIEDGPPGEDPTLHYGSWRNSFTGARFDEAEMRRAVEGTVARVAALGARRIVEIGCSTGLLLFRLAPRCERYVGLDLAAGPLAHVRDRLAAMPDVAPRVTLLQRSALDLSGLEAGMFDAVVMDSVVQYFPSTDYLVEVLRRASRLLVPGGKIFLGDVRSGALVPAFHALAVAHQAQGDESAVALAAKWQKEMAREKELALDSAFVAPLARAVPELTDARVYVKRGVDRNELSMFRYDVVLTMNAPRASEGAPLSWRSFRGEGMTLERLRTQLEGGGDSPFAFREIPNARLEGAARALAWLESGSSSSRGSELRAVTFGAERDRGVDPEALFRLGEEMGYVTHVGWSDSSARGDVAAVFAREPVPFVGLATPPPGAAFFPVARFARQPVDRHAEATMSELAALVRDACGADTKVRVVELTQIPRHDDGAVDLEP